jgi:hypothetical protein
VFKVRSRNLWYPPTVNNVKSNFFARAVILALAVSGFVIALPR